MLPRGILKGEYTSGYHVYRWTVPDIKYTGRPVYQISVQEYQVQDRIQNPEYRTEYWLLLKNFSFFLGFPKKRQYEYQIAWTSDCTATNRE